MALRLIPNSSGESFEVQSGDSHSSNFTTNFKEGQFYFRYDTQRPFLFQLWHRNDLEPVACSKVAPSPCHVLLDRDALRSPSENFCIDVETKQIIAHGPYTSVHSFGFGFCFILTGSESRKGPVFV